MTKLFFKNRYSVFVVFAVVAVILATSSCKKDKEEKGINIVGGWRDISSQVSRAGFYLFTSDKKMYKMYYGFDNYQKTDYSIYKLTNNQILVQSASSSLYNLRTSGDTLFFNDGSNDVITLLKDNLAPKSITDWSKSVTIADQFVDTLGSKTITYYNNRLYTFKYYSSGSKLVEYNPASHNVSALTAADIAYNGLDYVNGTLWCVDGQYSYIFNPGLGTFTFKSAATTNGNYLWATAGMNNTLYNYVSGAYYEYNTDNNTWGHNTEIDNDVTDMAIANGYLYVAKGGMIHRMHPYYRLPIDSWYLEGYTVNGIAFDGTWFWVTAVSKLTGEKDVLKVVLN